MQHFSPLQLKKYLLDHQPLLLDVREPWEYAICKLDGAQLIPMQQIPEHANTLDKQQEIVVICHHGVRSKAVYEYLEQQFEFNQLINLEGGMAAWARQVDPGMATY